MALTERLALLIQADGKGAVRELQAVGKATEKHLGTATNRMDKFAATSAKLGTGLVVGSALGLSALKKFGDAAGALNEQVSGAGVVFGRNADEVQAWSGTLAEAAGISATAALTAANNFGAMFDSAGLAGDEASAFSKALVQLGGDLASFKDTSTDDALSALRSGLSGEIEPLRRFDIFLTEAAVKAKAAELGLVGFSGSLSEGAKIQARYALIIEKSNLAQGDFARTSDSLANSQRRASAEAANAAAAFGQGVVGPYQAATAALGGLIAKLNEADPALAQAAGSTATIGTAAAGAVGGTALLASAVVRAKVAFAGAEGGLNRFGKSAKLLGKAGVAGIVTVGLDAIHASLTNINDELRDLESLKGDDLIAGFGDAVGDVEIGLVEGLTNIDAIKRRLTALPFVGDRSGLSDAEKESRAFTQLAEQNVASAQRLIDALKATGADTTEFEGILSGVVKELGGMGPASTLAANAITGIGAAMSRVSGGISGAGEAFATFGSKVQDLREALFGVPQAQLGVERAFHSLEDAELEVVDAERELAAARRGSDADSKAQVRSLRSVADAQKELGRSNEDVLESERALHDARLSFSDDLLDLELRAEDAALSLVEAQESERNTAGDFSATPNEVARAGLRRRQAERDLSDATTELDEVRTTGKTDAVRQAEDGLTAALEGQRSAQERLTDATGAHSELMAEQATKTDGVAGAQRRLERANLSLRDAQMSAMTASFDLETAMAELKIATSEQNTETDHLLGNLMDMQARYPQLADAIQPYIDKLNAIPKSIETIISLSLGQGVADVGSALSAIGGGLSAAGASSVATTNNAISMVVNPSQGMSEQQLGEIAARQLGWRLAIGGRHG